MEDLKPLVQQAQAGNLEAYGEIMRQLQDMAYGYAFSVLGDFHLAQDAAQEAFIQAYRDLHMLREPAAFPGWFRRIVLKHCDRIQRQRRPRTRSLDLTSGEPVSDELGPVEAAEKRELKDRVLAAVRKLPEHQRTVTTLFYIDGYSVQEVAAIQEVPVGTVKRRLHDARLKLKEEMMGMVEDTLKRESPRRELAQKVYEILKRYDRPSIPWQRWGEVKEKLREIGTDGMEGFIRALESPHSPTRSFAVSVLTDAGQSQEMVEKLLKEATRDSSKKVRRVAFGALCDIAWHNEEKRKDLMPHILPALRDRSMKVRRGAAWHLAHSPGFAQHVPLEEAAWAVVVETETDPLLLQNQHDLLEAVLCVREGKENPHEVY